MRRMGWTILVFVAIAFTGYVLSRGIYIGHSLTSYRVGDRTFFLKKCRYLHLNGTDEISFTGSSPRNPLTETDFCPRLQNSK